MHSMLDVDETITRSQLRSRILALRLEDARCTVPVTIDIPRLAPSHLELPAFPDSVGDDQVDRPPPWVIGLTKQFKKDIEGLDRKLQGRVLEVLAKLSSYSYPFHPEGDTFRPLTGDRIGCWRYRIGDHRLVIQPRFEYCQLDALIFASRGSVYE